MVNNIPERELVDSFVPISRFNKGEASMIFEEVKETGYKIVLKNNAPACVLLTPEVYHKLMEIQENYWLLIEAEKRMEKAGPEDFIPAKEALQMLGIRDTDIEDVEVEIE